MTLHKEEGKTVLRTVGMFLVGGRYGKLVIIDRKILTNYTSEKEDDKVDVFEEAPVRSQ